MPALMAGCLVFCLMQVLFGTAVRGERLQEPLPDDVMAAEGHHPVELPLSDAMSDALARRGRLQKRAVDGRLQWWLDSEWPPNGRLDPSDLLFETRWLAGRQQPFVTCGTCHDTLPQGAGEALRLDNRADALCMACHQR